jgi:hypothetical protein
MYINDDPLPLPEKPTVLVPPISTRSPAPQNTLPMFRVGGGPPQSSFEVLANRPRTPSLPPVIEEEMDPLAEFEEYLNSGLVIFVPEGTL